ncbi:fibrinogen like 1B [Synchiropus splendidus]|uniref:fibrinogen like 1B n=1 Tax=Synchiropus splendidus TaxID=270530 RepID=UPI00237E05B9|nr:fibrinogen like 1B [Synchiropus splendidus]
MRTGAVLLLLCSLAASSQASAGKPCHAQVAQLRLSVKKLQYQLLVATWQVEHLRTHKYFRPIRPNPDPQTEGRSNSSGATQLPPAGGLLVHDQDCSQVYERLRPPSGFYRVRPAARREPVLVYCDMEDGGGWTVFQRRRHGRVDFNRDWADYRDGFGDFKLWNDEFWLGNENIFSLLAEGRNLVKIELMDWEGKRRHAFYENFRITDEADKFRLRYGTYSGTAGDALTGGGGMVEQWSACLGGMQFSTRDQDNDRYLRGSCAEESKSGWWFNRCHQANLNGRFHRRGRYQGPSDDGVVWGTWRGLWYSLRHTSMKVRPLLFLDTAGSGGGAE